MPRPGREKAVVFDLMGVLLYPARLIKHGFAPATGIPYRKLKEAYEKAVVGNAKPLEELIPWEKQMKLLKEIVKPMVELERIADLVGEREAYGLTDLPVHWAVFLWREHLPFLNGLFASGAMGVRKAEGGIVMVGRALSGRDVVFLDDRKENVEEAERVGWRAFLVEGNTLEVLERALLER